tara:strand:- start:617 stop:982 length:366 start_codon:yes stop_codon:yes gene_type:complete
MNGREKSSLRRSLNALDMESVMQKRRRDPSPAEAVTPYHLAHQLKSWPGKRMPKSIDEVIDNELQEALKLIERSQAPTIPQSTLSPPVFNSLFDVNDRIFKESRARGFHPNAWPPGVDEDL